MFCLESRGEMPALGEEIEEASAEGIAINNSWGPKRIVAEHGRVVGVEFKRCLCVFDEDGRFNPTYDENDTKLVEADAVLISVGQAVAWGNLIAGSQMELNPNGTIKADPDTYQTGEPDVFAGGDALTGPKFAIDAIAAGKQGAVSIHRFVHPGQSLTLGRTRRDYRALDKANLDLEGYDRLPRQRPVHFEGKASRETFRDLRGTFTEEQVLKETQRCLGCGAAIVDQFLCVGCGSCTTKCKFDAISLLRKYDSAGVELKDLKPTVMKYALKRQLRITVKKSVNYLKSLVTSHKARKTT
jgi:ferredoxin